MKKAFVPPVPKPGTSSADKWTAPASIEGRADHDIFGRTKADLVKSFRSAGHTADQAKREAAILCRFASSRITGGEPNQVIKEIFWYDFAGGKSRVPAKDTLKCY